MGKRFAIVICVAAVGVMALGALATANSTSYNDPENDNTGNNCPPTNSRYCHKSFDFVKVSAGHSGDNLVFKATVRGKAKGAPFLSISTDKAKDCEYVLGMTKHTVLNCDTRAEAPAKYAGKKDGERGFRFVFSPDSIGNPNKYRWQFVYLADRGVLADEAPNKPDVYTLFGRPCPAAKWPCK
jgi:hypothetical protein